MSRLYQVLGPAVPSLLGRKRLLQQIDGHLLKPSPDHIQVVGPSLYGKSVLLNHLAAQHQSGSRAYITSAYADLRHGAPTTDEEFRHRLAAEAKGALSKKESELADFIVVGDPSMHEMLVFVFDELEKGSKCLLVVLDGFDHVLAGTGLTRNLWDQLRGLAQKRSLRLVTGSRRPLRELCRTDESRTSDFWEVFYDTPIQVGVFGEPDWDDVLAPLVAARIDIDGSGRKEIANWSGGVPILAIALLGKLVGRLCENNSCSKSDVDTIAEELLDERRQLLTEIWDDCDVDLRHDLAALAAKEADGILLSELSDARQRALSQRGFGASSGNRMRSSCRLMSKFAVQQAPAIADLKRLFATREAFNTNIRGLLEYRWAHVQEGKVDASLASYVETAIKDIDANPEQALTLVRSIANRALALIWEAELQPGQKLPDDWVNVWKQAGERLQWLDGAQRLPPGKGAQCNVLRLATGTENVRRLAKFVTKPTYLLLDSLQSVGDFGQHRTDFPESCVTKGFAAAIVLTAIELAESLTRDLEKQTTSGS